MIPGFARRTPEQVSEVARALVEARKPHAPDEGPGARPFADVARELDEARQANRAAVALRSALAKLAVADAAARANEAHAAARANEAHGRAVKAALATEAPKDPPGIPAAAPAPLATAQGHFRDGYREVVAAEGHDLVRWLGAAHEWARAALFDGRILAAMVLLTPPSSARALADYVPKDPHGIVSRIRIAPSVANLGCLRYLSDVLLHEMVHAWCNEVEADPEVSYRGHGPKYTARANAIGAVLGLPKVFVKGRIPEAEAAAVAEAMKDRGGEGAEPPDSARWPLCVRPADYYAAPEGHKPLNHGKAPKALPEPPDDEGQEPEASEAPPDAFPCLRQALAAIGAAILIGDHEAAGVLARQIRASLDASGQFRVGDGPGTWRAQMARAVFAGGGS